MMTVQTSKILDNILVSSVKETNDNLPKWIKNIIDLIQNNSVFSITNSGVHANLNKELQVGYNSKVGVGFTWEKPNSNACLGFDGKKLNLKLDFKL